MTQKQKIAKKNCANWYNGNCLGCMFVRVEDNLVMRMDSRYAGKTCAVDKKCRYFDNIVMRGSICT